MLCMSAGHTDCVLNNKSFVDVVVIRTGFLGCEEVFEHIKAMCGRAHSPHIPWLARTSDHVTNTSFKQRGLIGDVVDGRKPSSDLHELQLTGIPRRPVMNPLRPDDMPGRDGRSLFTVMPSS